MEFTFTVNIKETKGAVNTASVIAEKLNAATVVFGQLKKQQMPGIWVDFNDDKGQIFVACLKSAATWDFSGGCQEYGNWYTAYPARPYNGNEMFDVIFEYATDAAKEMIQSWIEQLCDEYENRLTSDKIIEFQTKFQEQNG